MYSNAKRKNGWKIKVRIKILNRNYELIGVEEKELNDYSTEMTYIGRANYVHTNIKISIDSSNVIQQETVIHEILHCIANQMGLSRLQDDEDMIDALSTGLLNVIRDNPKIIDYLQSNDCIHNFITEENCKFESNLLMKGSLK